MDGYVKQFGFKIIIMNNYEIKFVIKDKNFELVEASLV